MARIVMKFGGTSMAGTERIRRVANIVRKQVAGGNEVAVVVSAMAGETDRLVNFCREANALYDPAEYDVVVSSGEQVTSGLLALTLQSLGCKARSWLGWQIRQNPSKKNELAPGPAWANLGKSVSELHSTLTGAMALIFFLGANGGLVLSLVQDKVKQACWRICLQNPS